MKYPIGIQTFSEIIDKKYLYVDKTDFIPRLIKSGKYLFLNRPRRFGKSLLLSTLHSFFSNHRTLFRGLAIEREEVEWAEYPVIHIDLNPEDYSREGALEGLLDSVLHRYEEEYHLEAQGATPAVRFYRLVERMHMNTGRQVVILVDEYDKPLLGIEEDRKLFDRNQATLKGFFGVLKSADRHIHFSMLTGVARFNKVSIFSDLNMLRDISLLNEFSDICGWTGMELESTFRVGIEALGKENSMDYNTVLTRLKEYYDGYKFSARGERLYNPYSVLTALANQEFGKYWYRTGTPTFLVKRIKNGAFSLPALNHCRATEDQLLSVSPDDPNPIPILFQTGYLTIDSVEGDIYELRIPNKEVEIGFANSLQPLYLPEMNDLAGAYSVVEFRKELLEGNPEGFMQRIKAMVKGVPYEQHNEKFYQNIVYILFTLIGADARLEEHTNLGRADLVVRTGKYIYIFEFKYNGSASEAIRQIETKDYAGRFAVDGRHIFLIGVNFSTSTRGIDTYIIKERM